MLRNLWLYWKSSIFLTEFTEKDIISSFTTPYSVRGNVSLENRGDIWTTLNVFTEQDDEQAVGQCPSSTSVMSPLQLLLIILKNCKHTKHNICLIQFYTQPGVAHVLVPVCFVSFLVSARGRRAPQHTLPFNHNKMERKSHTDHRFISYSTF